MVTAVEVLGRVRAEGAQAREICLLLCVIVY
jgi:hypothetical protein